MKFGENEKSHGKVMEFHFLEKKKINNQELKMTVAVWLKIKRFVVRKRSWIFHNLVMESHGKVMEFNCPEGAGTLLT